MVQRGEFIVQHAYRYDHRSTGRWILSHIWRYRVYGLVTAVGFIAAWSAYSQAQVMIGNALEIALAGSGELWVIALIIFALLACDGLGMLIGSLSAENIAARFEADARRELYASLLAKSKVFHDRQRVGDLMARATDDAAQLSSMIVPGGTLMYETVLGIVVPLAFMIGINVELALVPLLFVAAYIIVGRRYVRRLSPVIDEQRAQFGRMNAGLEEAISGIEVVKATVREAFERSRFHRNARLFRDLFVRQGQIESLYIPLLLYGIALGMTFLHAMWLHSLGRVTIGGVMSVMALMNVLRFPTFISVFAFSVVQAGMSGARRMLQVITAAADLDENTGGFSAPMRGDITFDRVSFGYDNGSQDTASLEPWHGHVLREISFSIAAGQTVAIVGQTGSGKSALTQLVNRTYDASMGRVLIDGVDVREWSLDSLRSQIGKIEQDVFLFSRSIADNIAFGAPQATREQVEAAARASQAYDFISALPDGFDTVVGERGMTLSGGQRQRIALARAFLSDPRILILDDSTSAIDSATEDQIQQAIRSMQRGRTTLLITHRLSQIRRADVILVLDQGRLTAAGSHEELLRRSPHYRRIFVRYGVELPPLEEIVVEEASVGEEAGIEH